MTRRVSFARRRRSERWAAGTDLGEEDNGKLAPRVEIRRSDILPEFILARKLSSSVRFSGATERRAIQLGRHLDDANVRVGQFGRLAKDGEEVREEEMVREVVHR